ncbi:hypothetical protein D3C87_1968930 [compost metagenome]
MGLFLHERGIFSSPECHTNSKAPHYWLHGGYFRDVMAGDTLGATAASDCSTAGDSDFIHTFSFPGVQAGQR